ncbi:MAG: hypothetical protein ACMUIP_15900 [bacterium]
MKQNLLIILLGLFLLSVVVCPAKADFVDFESISLIEGDLITNQIPGLTFSNAIIAKTGDTEIAFMPNDTLSDDSFGEYFITDPVVNGDIGIPDTIHLSFETPVFNLSFQVADLDGSETFTAKAYDLMDNLQETITKNAGEPDTGDAIATLISFNYNSISRITMYTSIPSGGVGWGVDNFSYSVPIPSTCLLLLSGFIGIVGIKREFI